MGAWGPGILSDDTARDVYDEYLDRFNRGEPPELGRKSVLSKFNELVDDPDEGPVLWLAIAKAQWDCGHLETSVLSKVEEILAHDLGLDRWRDEGLRALERRKTVLQKFVTEIQQPNPRPRKPRKAVKRKPVFQPGDCLAVHLDSGNWGALLVLQGPPESSDPYENTFGINFVGVLQYVASAPPTLEVFERRNWYHWRSGVWAGQMVVCYAMTRFRNVKDRFVIVGKTALRDSDPKPRNPFYTSWPNLTMDNNYTG